MVSLAMTRRMTIQIILQTKSNMTQNNNDNFSNTTNHIKTKNNNENDNALVIPQLITT